MKRRDRDGSTVAHLHPARSERHLVAGEARSGTGSSRGMKIMGDHAGELQR
jgi:hypothetical protein